jgi:hypothetical protein
MLLPRDMALQPLARGPDAARRCFLFGLRKVLQFLTHYLIHDHNLFDVLNIEVFYIFSIDRSIFVPT